MRTIPRVLAAGVPDEYPVAGKFFRLMTTVGAVDVDLIQNGKVVYEARGVEAGFYAMPEGGFTGVRITSATSQTIKVAVSLGGGGYDRNTGDVNILPGSQVQILDSNGNGIATLSGLGGYVASQRRMIVTEGGYVYGVAYTSSTALGANTPQNVLAAGSNTNGVLVHAAGHAGTNGTPASYFLSLLAKATAPANPTDGDVLCHGSNMGITASTFYGFAELRNQVRVASGKRLDWICTAGAGGVLNYVNYTLL